MRVYMLNICGIIAFLLLYIDDFNLIFFKKRIFNHCFLFGTILLVLTTLINIIINFPKNITIEIAFYLLIALFFLGILIYTLFFALDFDEAYKDQGNNQKCIQTGVYALCRHPGVIWMFLMYLFLYFAIRNEAMLYMLVGYNFLNFIYIVIQDLIIFPRQFIDYQEYKKVVPFLLPTVNSIKKCIRTFRR